MHHRTSGLSSVFECSMFANIQAIKREKKLTEHPLIIIIFFSSFLYFHFHLMHILYSVCIFICFAFFFFLIFWYMENELSWRSKCTVRKWSEQIWFNRDNTNGNFSGRTFITIKWNHVFFFHHTLLFPCLHFSFLLFQYFN